MKAKQHDERTGRPTGALFHDIKSNGALLGSLFVDVLLLTKREERGTINPIKNIGFINKALMGEQEGTA